MATRKRPQLGALFGNGDGPSTVNRASNRLRAVGGGAADPADVTDDTMPPRPAAGRTPPRILLDADTPAAASTREPSLPWSSGGWLDPLVIAGQYFDFWQAVLDNSRRLVMGATAAATGRSVDDRD